MKNPTCGAAVAFLVACLGGCGSTTTHRFLVGPPMTPASTNVAVILDGSPLPPLFVEVAIVQAVGRGTQADLEHVIDGLRREAAAVGCDAVIRVRIDQGATTASGTGVAVRIQR